MGNKMNYYITLNAGFTYGPYNGKLEALLAGLNYYGYKKQLSETELNDLDMAEYLQSVSYRNGKTIIVNSESELKDKQEEIYYECDIYKQQSLESFINEFFNTCIESPIY